MANKSRKYPIGIQDFGELITGNYVYIDKTKHILELIESNKYYFLSRPRRFGKSLIISTLEHLFFGEKELFKRLYIEDKWDWRVKYPVIKISFNNIGENDLGLTLAIKRELERIYNLYEIPFEDDVNSILLKKLILLLFEKFGFQVVLLIDEYDKPIVDHLSKNIDRAVENRDDLKNLFSVLKDSDPYLKMIFITGISRFSKVSIFSDLNQLQDISLGHTFSSLCGITEDELKSNFQVELQSHDLNSIKEWYNGYTWDCKVWVYNPFSLMQYFRNQEFRNYWFTSATPTFLIEELKKHFIFDTNNITTSETALNNFDIENLNPVTLLFQTGYITIDNIDPDLFIYKMKIPNKEVRLSLLQNLADVFRNDDLMQSSSIINSLNKTLKEKDFETLKYCFNNLFATLPYDLWINNSEKFFHAIIHLAFTLLGQIVLSEVHVGNGRCDCLLFFDDKIFIFEFKIDQSSDLALQQIKDKKYLVPFIHKGKELIAVGIEFSKKNKVVNGLSWEIIE